MKPLHAAIMSCVFILTSCPSARSTSLEGLRTHLQANKKKYEKITPKLKRMGLIPMDAKTDIADDIERLGKIKGKGEEGDKALLSSDLEDKSIGARGAAGLQTARLAERMAGRPAKPVDGVSEDDVQAYDPETGRPMRRTEGDMYQAIIDAIVSAKCSAVSAEAAFRAILWGAVHLEILQRRDIPWPTMVPETRAIWEGHAAVIAKARKDFLASGSFGAAGDGMPVIIYRPQSEVGATATWQSGGIITVGDIYAGLSFPAKLAVLFHEDEHHWDSLTKSGLHDNYLTGTQPEPDDTPSGKNWTETLAYRHMGDWLDVLELGKPDMSAPARDFDHDIPSL